MYQGKKRIYLANYKLLVNNEKVKRLDINQYERILGFFMVSPLKWERQFNKMVHKMKQAIAKLKNTTITILVVYIYYNMYLLTKVYFRCGIMKITDKQEEYLMKIYEPTILKKLGFSVKFPHNILYAWKLALGIGIIKSSTVIKTLALK